MAPLCPAPDLKDALVQSLLVSTDCHVRALVETGYGAIFGAQGQFGAVLTALLVIYVALIGFRLMLGRGPLSVGETVLNAVKLSAVLALATQWSTYSQLVFRLVFDGPQELATALQHAIRGPVADGVFERLQPPFDALTLFSPATPPGVHPRDPFAAAAMPVTQLELMTKPSFDALLLLISAGVLLSSTLVTLLAAKIVVGVLLALGPAFIALLLFESTRGLFIGWLRATLAFALTPLFITLTLELGLLLLGPYLAQIELMRDTDSYVPGVAITVLVLVIVLAGVSAAVALACGLAASGVKLAPRLPRSGRASAARSSVRTSGADPAGVAERPGRVLGVAEAIGRRDALAARRSSSASAGSGEPDAARAASPAPRRTIRPPSAHRER